MSGNQQNIDDKGLRRALSHNPFPPKGGARFSVFAFQCLCVQVLFFTLSGFATTLPKLTSPAKIDVIADKVTLGMLLRPDPADAKLASQLDTVGLTAAPAPGQSKTVLASEILRRLESMGITSKTHLLVVPAEVTIVRAAQTVTPAEISRRIVEEFLPGLPWKGVRLERVDVTENFLLPSGKTEWIFVCHPGTDFAKPFYLNINFSVNGDVAKRAFLRTVLSVRDRVAVSLTELKAAQSVREEDIRWESQRLLSTLQTPVRSSDFFRGRRPRAAIPAGRILTENLFVPIPLVKRGDSVLLVFENESMRLTTQAKALAMGFRGQRIQVMNPESGKIVSAEITAEGTARVVQ